MRTVLYKDRFVEVYGDEVVISTYYFPIATSKHIPIHDIRFVYYKKQECWEDIFTTKGWGMTLYPVWWACDLRRHIQMGKNRPHFNVIIDNGTFPKKGFTVENIEKFLAALRPLTDAPFENRFPDSFEHQVAVPPKEHIVNENGKDANEKKVGEYYQGELRNRKAVEAQSEAPPSYDEATSVDKNKLL